VGGGFGGGLDWRGANGEGILPAAAEGLIELDHGEELVELGLRKIEARGEVIGFVGEDLEVAGGASVIADVGEARGVFGGVGEFFLLSAKFLIFLISDEGVSDVTEGQLNGLPIDGDEFVTLGFGESDGRTDATSGEDRLREGRSEGPQASGAGEKIRERTTLQSGCGGEADLWKVRGASDADLCVGGDELEFSGANVRTTLEQSGR